MFTAIKDALAIRGLIKPDFSKMINLNNLIKITPLDDGKFEIDATDLRYYLPNTHDLVSYYIMGFYKIHPKSILESDRGVEALADIMSFIDNDCYFEMNGKTYCCINNRLFIEGFNQYIDLETNRAFGLTCGVFKTKEMSYLDGSDCDAVDNLNDTALVREFKTKRGGGYRKTVVITPYQLKILYTLKHMPPETSCCLTICR